MQGFPRADAFVAVWQPVLDAAGLDVDGQGGEIRRCAGPVPPRQQVHDRGERRLILGFERDAGVGWTGPQPSARRQHRVAEGVAALPVRGEHPVLAAAAAVFQGKMVVLFIGAGLEAQRHPWQQPCQGVGFQLEAAGGGQRVRRSEYRRRGQARQLHLFQEEVEQGLVRAA